MSLLAASASGPAVDPLSRSIRQVTAGILVVMVVGTLLASRWAQETDSLLATVVAVALCSYTLLGAIPLVAVMWRIDRAATELGSESGIETDDDTESAGAIIYQFPTMHAKVS
jgi:hypothetical protein